MVMREVADGKCAPPRRRHRCGCARLRPARGQPGVARLPVCARARARACALSLSLLHRQRAGGRKARAKQQHTLLSHSAPSTHYLLCGHWLRPWLQTPCAHMAARHATRPGLGARTSSWPIEPWFPWPPPKKGKGIGGAGRAGEKGAWALLGRRGQVQMEYRVLAPPRLAPGSLAVCSLALGPEPSSPPPSAPSQSLLCACFIACFLC